MVGDDFSNPRIYELISNISDSVLSILKYLQIDKNDLIYYEIVYESTRLQPSNLTLKQLDSIDNVINRLIDKYPNDYLLYPKCNDILDLTFKIREMCDIQ